MVGRVVAAMTGGTPTALIGPLLMRHAARLEQVPDVAVFADADVAARALRAAQRLYGLDVVFASTTDSVAWAIRSLARPGLPLATLIAEHERGLPTPAIGDVDAVADSPVTVHAVELIQRLRVLTGGAADIGIVVPTAQTLSDSLSGAISPTEADAACGAFLRAVGAAEPDVVLRVGGGERGSIATGTCQFFTVPLIEVGAETTTGVGIFDIDVPDPPPTNVWLYVTTAELQAETTAQAVTDAVALLRKD